MTKIFEGASAIVFAGVLAALPGLEREGGSALRELHGRGYSVPSSQAPVSVVVLEGASSRHAAGWRPSVISLRPEPYGALPASVYLRHELMHEANHRTCQPSLPHWANEAAALAFSGELTGYNDSAPVRGEPSSNDLESVRRAVRLRAPLMPSHLQVLGQLVSRYGWPTKPCALSTEIEQIISEHSAHRGGLSYVLMSYASGRVLEHAGDQTAAYPIGSLLKVPFLASLRPPVTQLEARALLASDTEVLLRSASRIDQGRYRDLVVGVGGVWRDELKGRVLLGDRDQHGDFPLEFTLTEAARLMRLSFMRARGDFSVLREQGTDEHSTLRAAPVKFRTLMQQLGAGAKTGSISDSSGEPVVGHLTILWPLEAPTLVAVFRKTGVRGADVADAALSIMERWRTEYDSSEINVRVRLLSELPRAAWKIAPFGGIQGCREEQLQAGQRTTSCGVWTIETSARKARPWRLVAGIIDTDEASLTTDRGTYAEAVLASEGDGLPRSAKEALRAVIAWNGVHGASSHSHRHEQLCDTSHCMVFLGHSESQRKLLFSPAARLDTDSFAFLRDVSDGGRQWFPFSAGGELQWEQQVSGERIAQIAKEPAVLGLRREVRRTGEVFVRLVYESGEESVPCEQIMTMLDLPSCPDRVRPVDGGHYLFSGIGRGHGRGLSVERARSLSLRGVSASEILRDAYGVKQELSGALVSR